MSGPVLLIDVYSLLLRSTFALPSLRTSRGEPTAGLYGFAASLLKLLREVQPVGVAFAIDPIGPTFRHRAYPGYKASRSPARGTSPARTGLAKLLAAFGFPCHCVSGFEADDVLATLAREIGESGAQPVVVSGDRDCLQLAHGPTTVLYLTNGPASPVRYDAAAVRARFGVEPGRLPDLMALVGDPSDALPGVSGIGLRTATRLLTTFGNLDGLLDSIERVDPPRLRRTLTAQADEARLWRDLARLRDDVPLAPGPSFAAFERRARTRVKRLFTTLEFHSLEPRLAALPATG